MEKFRAYLIVELMSKGSVFDIEDAVGHDFVEPI
jgi:hypothetical protein